MELDEDNTNHKHINITSQKVITGVNFFTALTFGGIIINSPAREKIVLGTYHQTNIAIRPSTSVPEIGLKMKLGR